MYQYRATVHRVVDGDTIDFDIDLGFYTWILDQRVRLIDIDTPETRTRDLVEKSFGILAKEYVESQLPIGRRVIINTTLREKDKYGRILAEVYLTDDANMLPRTTLNQDLVAKHYAVPYTGQNKDEIRELHAQNRQLLIERGEVEFSTGLS